MSLTRFVVLVGALAGALLGARGVAAVEGPPADGLPVVWSTDSLAYVAWPERGGASAGAFVFTRGAGRTPLDTLEVVWVRDAIAAIRPLPGARPPARGQTVALVGAIAEPRDPSRGLLRIPISGSPDALDPLYATTLAEKQIVTQLFAGLVRLDASLAPMPGLAARWSVDGAGYTFSLSDDARFHDHRPVTAADVRATLLRALSPKAHAPRVEGLAEVILGGRAYHSGTVDTLEGVRIIDPRTLEITASSPRAPLLGELAAPAAMIVPAGTPPAPMDERTLLAAQSGPFYITGTTARALSLAAAPGRSGGPAGLDLVRVDGPSDAAVEFELDRLDVVAPPQAIAGRLQVAGGVRATELTCDEIATYYLGFDTRRPFLADREHRRVLAGLIDRALAVRVLVPGRGRLAGGLLPPLFGVPAPPESAWMMPRALAETRARGGFGGKAPELSLWIPVGSEVGMRLAEYVTAAWRRSGLRVTIVERAWPEFRRGVAAGEADVFYWSWFADGPDPVAFLASMTASDRRGDGGNRTQYANASVDRELAAARGAPSDIAATQALRRAELLALADAPLVPLFHPINVTLVRPGVSGLVLDPLGAPRYDTVEVR